MFSPKFSGPSGLETCLSQFLSFIVATFKRLQGMLLLVVSTLFLTKNRSTTKPGHSKSINSVLPRVKWLPITIPMIDGLIAAFKLRKIGVKMPQQLSAIYGSTYKIGFGLSSLILTSDPDHIKAILSSTSEDHLNKPAHFYNVLLNSTLKDGLVGSPHETWKTHRRALVPVFTYKSLITYSKFIHGCCQNFIGEVSKRIDNKGVIHSSCMKEEIYKMALTLTSKVILGSENTILSADERNKFQEAVLQAKNASLERVTNPEQMLSIVWAFHPNKRRLDKATTEMYRHVNKLIGMYRTNDINKANEKNDITNYSLDAPTDSEYYELQKQNENGKRKNEIGVKPYESLMERLINASFTNKEIVDEVTTFMVVGFESLTTTMELLLFNLAYNRDAQVRCQEEVDELMLEHFPSQSKTACFTMEHLAKLKYLERCILESLRLTPTFPMILRWLEQPLQVNKDSHFEGGQTMCLYIWGVHRNPKIYPDPEKFDPDRFIPEAVKARHSHAFLPFSLGARNCIGWKLVLIEMKILLAKIVSEFEFWTTDKPDDVKLDIHITLKPERTHNVYFRRRPSKSK